MHRPMDTVAPHEAGLSSAVRVPGRALHLAIVADDREISLLSTVITFSALGRIALHQCGPIHKHVVMRMWIAL